MTNLKSWISQIMTCPTANRTDIYYLFGAIMHGWDDLAKINSVLITHDCDTYLRCVQELDEHEGWVRNPYADSVDALSQWKYTETLGQNPLEQKSRKIIVDSCNEALQKPQKQITDMVQSMRAKQIPHTDTPTIVLKNIIKARRLLEESVRNQSPDLLTEQALGLLSDALQRPTDENLTTAYLMRGWITWKIKGDPASALNDLKESVKTAPAHSVEAVWAHYHFCEAQREAGHLSLDLAKSYLSACEAAQHTKQLENEMIIAALKGISYVVKYTPDNTQNNAGYTHLKDELVKPWVKYHIERAPYLLARIQEHCWSDLWAYTKKIYHGLCDKTRKECQNKMDKVRLILNKTAQMYVRYGTEAKFLKDAFQLQETARHMVPETEMSWWRNDRWFHDYMYSSYLDGPEPLQERHSRFRWQKEKIEEQYEKERCSYQYINEIETVMEHPAADSIFWITIAPCTIFGTAAYGIGGMIAGVVGGFFLSLILVYVYCAPAQYLHNRNRIPTNERRRAIAEQNAKAKFDHAINSNPDLKQICEHFDECQMVKNLWSEIDRHTIQDIRKKLS